MPKKGRLTEEKEWAEKAYYRWEFIRRNKTYQEDQARFVSRFSKWFKQRGLSLNSITGLDRLLFEKHSVYGTYFEKNIVPYLMAFRNKWDVRWPCRPSFTFTPDFLDTFSDNTKDIINNYRNSPILSLAGNLDLNANLEELAKAIHDSRLRKYRPDINKYLGETFSKSLVYDIAGNGRYISLTFPPRTLENNKKYNEAFGKILDEMCNSTNPDREKIQKFFPEALIKIEDFKEEKKPSNLSFTVRPELGKERNYSLFHEFMKKIEWPPEISPTKRSTKRIHLKKYKLYLQVWDLKNAGATITWAEIAKRLYPEEFARYASGHLIGSKNPVVQQVIDQYQSAQHLITNGFQEIR
jgi:hypothetical protein